MRALEQIIAEIDLAVLAEKDRIAQIAETVWKNPETGYKEFKTSAFAQNILRENGYTVQAPLAITGFRADWDSGRPGPCIAILGELDGLTLPSAPGADPQTGAFHACGHHTHIASMLAVAVVLKKLAPEQELCGKIVFIGCPGEECIDLEWRNELIRSGKIGALGGKASLIREGVFRDVDAAIMIHVSRSNAFNLCAGNGFVKKMIRFTGKSCHAATPADGVNALNSAALSLDAIAMLRETFRYEDGVRVHGIMTHGGDAINIIPDDVRMEYQIRACRFGTIVDVSQKFDRALLGCASALDAKVEIQTLPGYLPMINTPELYELYLKHAYDVFGKPDSPGEPFLPAGSTDMGDVSFVVPAIHPCCPGADGVPHGVDFSVPDPGGTCSCMARTMLRMAAELLYGNAGNFEPLRKFRDRCCVSTEKYISMTDSLWNTVVSPPDGIK